MDSRYIVFKKKSQNGDSYAMGMERTNDITWFNFKIPPMVQGEMLVDNPDVTRLFSEPQEAHDKTWLNYVGGKSTEYTKMGNTIVPYQVEYELFDKGIIKFGEHSPVHDEIWLTGSKLSGRWILRTIENVFDRTMFSSDNVTLLWKPRKQATKMGEKLEEAVCPCIMENAKSKNGEQKTFEVPTKFESELLINDVTHEVSGIAAAEGTWIDMFGNKFTYTASFMDTLFKRMKEKIPLITMDKDHNSEDRGLVETVNMVQEPIKHITAKGRYNGSIDEVRGFSLEMMLKSVWSDEFQSWIPFDANPERLSLVGSPACKICWINQVN